MDTNKDKIKVKLHLELGSYKIDLDFEANNEDVKDLITGHTVSQNNLFNNIKRQDEILQSKLKQTTDTNESAKTLLEATKTHKKVVEKIHLRHIKNLMELIHIFSYKTGYELSKLTDYK